MTKRFLSLHSFILEADGTKVTKREISLQRSFYPLTRVLYVSFMLPSASVVAL